MYTRQQLLEIDSNPGMLHVSVVNGSVWFSEDAIADLEALTGRKPPMHSLREVLVYLDLESAKLQCDTFNESAHAMNWAGFCLMRSLRHAIETKMFGSELAGEFPDAQSMHDAFVCGPQASTADALH